MRNAPTMSMFDKWKDKKDNPFSVLNKDAQYQYYIAYQFNKLCTAYKIKNLDENINERVLKQYLMWNGNAAFAEFDGVLYALNGTRGGPGDAYYVPRKWIGANPFIKKAGGESYELEDGVNCVVVKNDSLEIGLLPLFSKYAQMLVENDISFYQNIIQSRLINIMTAPDDKTAESARAFLKQVEDGRLGIIVDNPLGSADLGRFMVQQATNINGLLTQQIEVNQYISSKWLMEIGIPANWNAKREAVNDDELEQNTLPSLPLFDDMMQTQQEGLDKVNQMFGRNFQIERTSAQGYVLDELEKAVEQLNEEDPEEKEEQEEKPEEEAKDNDTE